MRRLHGSRSPQGKVSSPPFTPSICLKYSLSFFSHADISFFHLFSSHFLYLPDIVSHARYFLNFFLFIPSSLVSSRFISLSSVSFPFLSFFPFHFLSFHCRCYFPSLRFTFTVLKSSLVRVCSTDLVQIPMINRVLL